MSYLQVETLTKNYGKLIAVDQLNLVVSPGELVSLLGPSGCGKSTTLLMIAGFIEPTGGTVVLGGRNLLLVPPNQRGLGIVFQSYALFPHMTVAQNVGFGLEMQKLPSLERHERVAQILQLVELSELAGRYPREISGGQQQRVAVARALVTRPKLLLLDEPLSNLDAKLREGMQEELRQIHRTFEITTILVTHDQSEALALSDRIVLMNKGRVEQIGTPLEVYNRPATPFAASFLGRTNIIRPIGTGKDSNLVNVRPEQIQFAAEGLAGVVSSRVFWGPSWFFHVGTELGDIIVICQNYGSAVPKEGDRVHLVWGDHSATIGKSCLIPTSHNADSLGDSPTRK